MLLNNNTTRIARISFGAGTMDHHHITCSTSSSSSSLSCSSTQLKKRLHRSCQSSCQQPKVNDTALKVGQRVSVASLCAIGTIRFIGNTSFKPGLWVGIELDITGAGKNDGSIKGVRYFTCPAETGLFILANKVAPLKESSSCSLPSISSITVTPKKSLTLNTSTSKQASNAKKATMTPTSTSKSTTRRPRQRCSSHEQPHEQPANTTASLSTSLNTRKRLTTSLSTRTSSADIPSSVKKSAVSVSTKKSSVSTKTTTSQRKSTTPILATQRKLSSSPTLATQQKTSPSKSTRRTMTPTSTTTKKRNSTSSSPTSAKNNQDGAPPPETLRKSKSTSTRQVVTKDELKKMHALLEQSRQEKERLSDEMSGKEAVWERLVTAKESYALKVQDMELELTRLRDSLQLSQQHSAQLESQLLQYKASSMSSSSSSSSSLLLMSPSSMSPTDNSIFSNGGTITVGTMEQQYIRRIEKLDRLVREWQQDAQESHQQVQQLQRTHAAQIEQLRRELAERDQATATMEREYEETKLASNKTLLQYESTMAQWAAERDIAIKSKDEEIHRLHCIINELKSCHFLLPPSPNNDEDEEDIDELTLEHKDRLTATSHINNDDHSEDYAHADDGDADDVPTSIRAGKSGGKMYSSRRRLEQQLELTTTALDDVQQQQKATMKENEQLREQISHMHAASSAADQQFQHLQSDLSVEINDKRLLMEERDAALQAQLRMEEEHKDLVMTNTRLEHQLGELTERLEQLQDNLSTANHSLSTSQEELHKLQQEWNVLQDAHNAMEQECSRLMDEILDLEQRDNGTADGSTTVSSFMRNEMDRMKQQIAKWQLKLNDSDTQHRAKIGQLHNEIAQLESVIEEKSFKISELEELYQAERRKTQQQTEQRQWMESSSQAHALKAKSKRKQRRSRNHSNKSSSSSASSTSYVPCSGIILPISPISDTSSMNESFSSKFGASHADDQDDQVDDSLYCEICEVHGHDVISCNAINMTTSYQGDHQEESSSVYCVNCDVFDTHDTTNCPNQDETY